MASIIGTYGGEIEVVEYFDAILPGVGVTVLADAFVIKPVDL